MGKNSVQAYFPEFWNDHERLWTAPQKPSLKRVFLYNFKYDPQGIIYMQRRLLEGRKKIYSPIRIMQHALRFYNEHLEATSPSKREAKKNSFILYASWLLDHITEEKKRACWIHHERMNLAGYTFSSPWISAMEQGFGLSVFIRYYSFADAATKKRLHSIMQKIVTTFGMTVENGGVRDESNGVWYDEYATPVRGHVLNGFMYALLGLYEYWKYSGNTDAKRYFYEGIETLCKKLPQYEVNLGAFRWSRYDSKNIFYAGWHYHVHVHIPQLRILYSITRRKELLETAKRWEQYKQSYGHIARVVDTPLLGMLKLQGVTRL